MGKASDLFEEVSARPLSAAEIAARQAAVAGGGEAQATSDGELVKRESTADAPRTVFAAPTQTWD